MFNVTFSAVLEEVVSVEVVVELSAAALDVPAVEVVEEVEPPQAVKASEAIAKTLVNKFLDFICNFPPM
jgi:hypothetical protein